MTFALPSRRSAVKEMKTQSLFLFHYHILLMKTWTFVAFLSFDHNSQDCFNVIFDGERPVTLVHTKIPAIGWIAMKFSSDIRDLFL